MADPKKVIVTNGSALRSKYGAGFARIERALRDLTSVNDQDLPTQLVELDNSAHMPGNQCVVRDATSAAQAKVAIDAVYEHCHHPEYLVILGGIDIVPQQPLWNPMQSRDDFSEIVPSDLPYACDSKYSLDIEQCTGPTRVIGRLPDVTGYSNPAYLERLLGNAASARPHDAPGGNRVLAISTKKWDSLTFDALKMSYPHSVPSIHVSPGEGPDWADIYLKLPVHFINCHGGGSDCRYYGDSGEQPQADASDPIAHDSACIAKRLTPGTVAVAECCFGAQLYDPADTGGVAGIGTTYLANGAYAFFGSSGVAYGGETCNESADVLCGLFLRQLLNGATSGYAALSAVQEFIGSCKSPIDAVQLKTIAQFSLMGDPSVRPFLPRNAAPAGEGAVPAGGPPMLHLLAGRAGRRAGLLKRGDELRRVTATAGIPIHIPDRQKTIDEVLHVAGVTDWGAPDLLSFGVTPAEEPPDEETGASTLVHILARPTVARQAPFATIELIVATEVDGKIVSFRRVSSRGAAARCTTVK